MLGHHLDRTPSVCVRSPALYCHVFQLSDGECTLFRMCCHLYSVFLAYFSVQMTRGVQISEFSSGSVKVLNCSGHKSGPSGFQLLHLAHLAQVRVVNTGTSPPMDQ